LVNCRLLDDADTRTVRQAAIALVYRTLTELAGRVRVEGSLIPESDRGDLVNNLVVRILDHDGLQLETTTDVGARSYLASMLRTNTLDRLRKDKPHRHLSIGNPETDDGTVDIDVELHRLGIHPEQAVPVELEAAAARLKLLAALAKESCGEAAFAELVALRVADDPAELRKGLIDAEQARTGDAKKARDTVNQRISRARARLKRSIENDPGLELDERHDLLVFVDALRERRASAAAPDSHVGQ
jgi:hypothetical protein